MVERGEGAQYRPSPAPQGADAALTQWAQREFDRIGVSQTEGRSQWLRIDVLEVIPNRPIEGMVCYFAGGVVSVGSAKGFYGYNGTAWTQL
jgi:hypothetical protein